ncbi:MAG: hypothetical protein J7539_15270 [Niabella sp.]|nr:hypothetical protein [Niabella sp.]
MPAHSDSSQILLFHELLYGTSQSSRQARQCLMTDYDFTSHQLPGYLPGTIQDGILRPDPQRRYVFRSVSDHTYSFLDRHVAQLKGLRLKAPKNTQQIGPDYRAVADQTYYRRNPAVEYLSRNWMPVGSLGLGVTGTATEAYLKITNYEGFKAAVKQGEFIANWNGKRVWKAGFRGNASVSSGIVASEKAAFEASYSTMKLVEKIGHASAFIGIGLSALDATDKGWTKEATGKFTLDVIMTGVVIVPVVGWAISGLYFITDAALTLNGNDWWHLVWEKVVLPTRASLQNAEKVYIEAVNNSKIRNGYLYGPF